MTHQNHQTNGASLEDCHTNFFALVSSYFFDSHLLLYACTSFPTGFPIFSFPTLTPKYPKKEKKEEKKASHLSRALF